MIDNQLLLQKTMKYAQAMAGGSFRNRRPPRCFASKKGRWRTEEDNFVNALKDRLRKFVHILRSRDTHLDLKNSVDGCLLSWSLLLLVRKCIAQNSKSP